MNVATYMWANVYGRALLKMTDQRSTLVTSPAAFISKPPGWFIQALAESTMNAPPSPKNGIGTPLQKCAQGLRRVHPKM